MNITKKIKPLYYYYISSWLSWLHYLIWSFSKTLHLELHIPFCHLGLLLWEINILMKAILLIGKVFNPFFRLYELFGPENSIMSMIIHRFSFLVSAHGQRISNIMLGGEGSLNPALMHDSIMEAPTVLHSIYIRYQGSNVDN